MEPILKVFVAGSKELKTERMTCRSVCNVLQNQWGTILTKTFEDFPESISLVGHQNEYNAFIQNEADVVIFIFSDKVGDITISEFEHSYRSFISSGHPKILVYIDASRDVSSIEVENLKEEFSLKGQYYKEYLGIGDLEQMVDKHLTKILIERSKNENSKTSLIKSFLKVSRKALILLGIWCLLALIGGVGMYIYDNTMSEAECIDLAAKYVEAGRDQELVYYFPEETFIFNIDTQQLDIIPRRNSASSTDIALSKIEHAAFGASASILFARAVKFKVKGNYKTVLAYVAAMAIGAIGFGVGCVFEQMIFPPQYSKPVRNFLSVPSNWEKVDLKRYPSHIF